MVKEQLKLDSITDKYHPCNLCKTDDVILDFDNVKLVFIGCLIFKCGYPNEEIYLHYEYYTQGPMYKHCLYEMIDSDWVKELNAMNRVHPRHRDDLFKYKHFIILFEDEVFECLAKSYELKA
jgi:hypothetical protein